MLEGMVREKAQEFIQQIMEEEVTELLGREKSECRSTVDSAEGYRNGYGKPRRLAMSSAVKSRVVCKNERKLLDASVRLPWRPPCGTCQRQWDTLRD